jgi:hypothetical protein
MSSDTVYRRANIEGHVLGDEMVFFDDRVGKYFAIGPVGANIWKLLETPMTLGAIVASLMDEYEVDEATCRSETVAFVEKMLAARLFEITA